MKTTPTLFILGDSISIQYGPHLERYLAGSFHDARKQGETEALLNLDIPAGANGGDSSMVLHYLRAAPQHGEIGSPDYLLINCGLHDIKIDPESGEKQIGPQLYRANLEGIAAAAGILGGRFVWIRTTPCDENIHNARQQQFHRFGADVREYNRIADEVMRGRMVPIIDLYSFTQTLASGPDLFIDHVHFPVHVQELQAAFIAGCLTALKADTR